jgi:hypothetical protein
MYQEKSGNPDPENTSDACRHFKNIFTGPEKLEKARKVSRVQAPAIVVNGD